MVCYLSNRGSQSAKWFAFPLFIRLQRLETLRRQLHDILTNY